MNKLMTILVIALATASFGCAHIQEFAAEHIPDIEAKAGGSGIGLSIDPKLGVEVFCLNEYGATTGYLKKIPILGSIIVDVVGTCEMEETATEEVAEPAAPVAE